MAEILITGVEIPKKGNVGILIYADGSVEVCATGTLSRPIYGVSTTKAEELPPHGVLKDIDVLNDAIIEAERYGEITGGEAGFFKAILTNAPRVIDTSKH